MFYWGGGGVFSHKWVQECHHGLKMRTQIYSEVTAKYRPINIHIYIFSRGFSILETTKPKPDSSVSSNVPVDNEYSGYNTDGEGCLCVLF